MASDATCRSSPRYFKMLKGTENSGTGNEVLTGSQFLAVTSHMKCQPMGNSRSVIHNHNVVELEEEAEGTKSKNFILFLPQIDTNSSVGGTGGDFALDPQRRSSPEAPRFSQGEAEVRLVPKNKSICQSQQPPRTTTITKMAGKKNTGASHH